jgi:hypothetical protein
MAVATRIAAKFNTYYAEKPGMVLPFALCPVLFPAGLSANMSALIVLTTMVTNAVRLQSIYLSPPSSEILNSNQPLLSTS